MPRQVPLKQVRNIGIMAHIDAGKTTTTERILFHSGKTYKIGEVDDGTAVMDWMPQEQERGITITSAATTLVWKDYWLNLIDTPGHVDFTVEVERSLRVLDGAVMVLCAVGGVEPQSSTVWRQADRYKVPRIAYVNKLDRIGADFYKVIADMHKKLAANAHAVQIPVLKPESTTVLGVIDLIEMQYYRYTPGDDSGKFETLDIPEEYLEQANAKRDELVQACADLEEEIMELYISGEPVSKHKIRKAIRKGVLSNTFVPVLCGTSLKNVGVQPLLDAVVEYLPSPKDVPDTQGHHPRSGAKETREANDNAPFCGLAFKIATDSFVGKLVYVRVYSGTLKKGDSILNATTGKKERVGRIIRMHANDREDIDEVRTGDIVAMVGLRAKTGHTLSADKAPIILESMSIPEPVMSIAIEPKTQADKDKLFEVLNKIEEEDPSFRISVNEESGQTIISGMGELHLDIIRDRMLREFNVGASFGNPRVAYRETILESGRGENKFVRQTGGKGQYGHVVLRVQPTQRGSGISVVNRIVGGVIPKEFIKPIETGIREAAMTGVLASFRVDDVEVTIEDGSFHETDSTEIAFSIAASMAFKEAVRKASPILLEPIMSVEIMTPEQFTGELVGDVNSRRGKVKDIVPALNSKLIKAEIPLSELFGYATVIRSLTQGQATYTMEPCTFEQVPEAVSSKIIG